MVSDLADCFPRGEAVEFSVRLYARMVLGKCWANRENETEEECGQKCSKIANDGTFSFVRQRHRYPFCTESKCISRIPHPSFARRQTKILQRITSPLSAFKCHLSRRSKVRLRRQITAIYAEAPRGKVYALSYNPHFLTHWQKADFFRSRLFDYLLAWVSQ